MGFRASSLAVAVTNSGYLPCKAVYRPNSRRCTTAYTHARALFARMGMHCCSVHPCVGCPIHVSWEEMAARTQWGTPNLTAIWLRMHDSKRRLQWYKNKAFKYSRHTDGLTLLK